MLCVLFGLDLKSIGFLLLIHRKEKSAKVLKLLVGVYHYGKSVKNFHRLGRIFYCY